MIRYIKTRQTAFQFTCVHSFLKASNFFQQLKDTLMTNKICFAVCYFFHCKYIVYFQLKNYMYLNTKKKKLTLLLNVRVKSSRLMLLSHFSRLSFSDSGGNLKTATFFSLETLL